MERDWLTDRRPTDVMQGLAKGLAVIEAFGEGSLGLSVSDVAERTGLDRATARRCLLTLDALGYADYDGKYFRLAPRTLRLGLAYTRSASLPATVQPVLEGISEQTGESASVSLLDDTEIIYVARASQKRVMAINLMPGSRLPAYCSSMGRVLLAALPPAKARDVLERSDRHAHTPRTVTDIDALMKILTDVAAAGYAGIDQELELGLCSLSVPLLNSAGAVVAAMNVGANLVRSPLPQMIDTYLPLLLKAQASLRPLLDSRL
ncbi:IclR family transcriptional regulator C-terminal domain-containing protein [Pelagibius sp. 7325]|uniref:IclR family transcriptional regulator domain-containing protein n=1 Tax=Pelagibius sp. 7325 TaxID=3131994 RepID=UPI0030EEEAFC